MPRSLLSFLATAALAANIVSPVFADPVPIATPATMTNEQGRAIVMGCLLHPDASDIDTKMPAPPFGPYAITWAEAQAGTLFKACLAKHGIDTSTVFANTKPAADDAQQTALDPK